MFIDDYNQNQNDSKYDFDLNKYKEENGIKGDIEIMYDTNGNLLDKFAKTSKTTKSNSNSSNSNSNNSTPNKLNNSKNQQNIVKTTVPSQSNPVPNNKENNEISSQPQTHTESIPKNNNINKGENKSKTSTDNLIPKSNHVNNKVNSFIAPPKDTNTNSFQPDNGKLTIEKGNNDPKQFSFNTLLIPIFGIIPLFVVGAAIFRYKKRSNGKKSSNSETSSIMNYSVFDSYSDNEKSNVSDVGTDDKSSQDLSYTDLIKKDRSNYTLSFYQSDNFSNGSNSMNFSTIARNGNTSFDYSDSYDSQDNSFHSDNYSIPEPAFFNNYRVSSYYN